MADEERARREVRILPAVIGAGIAVAIAVGVVAYAAGHYGEQTKTVTTQAAGAERRRRRPVEGLARRSPPARTRSSSSRCVAVPRHAGPRRRRSRPCRR